LKQYLQDATIVQQLNSNVSTLLLATALHSPTKMQESIDKHCVLNFVTTYLYKDEFYNKIIRVSEDAASIKDEYKPVASIQLKPLVTFI
jgi:hypothetical protein